MLHIYTRRHRYTNSVCSPLLRLLCSKIKRKEFLKLIYDKIVVLLAAFLLLPHGDKLGCFNFRSQSWWNNLKPGNANTRDITQIFCRNKFIE